MAYVPRERFVVVCDAVEAACPGLSGTFEVIVDYKGSRRPDTQEDHWSLGEWRVQTYAWLRQRRQLAHPVAAGILIYVNELAPGSDDIRRLRTAIAQGRTDVFPLRGDPDFYALDAWTAGAASGLSEAFRFRRAIRVIPITDDSITRATDEFDRQVGRPGDRRYRDRARPSVCPQSGSAPVQEPARRVDRDDRRMA
jgi:hypothetical protein